MAILNYTTTIDPTKTIGEIQGILAKAGVASISVDYANRIPVGLTFLIKLNDEFVNFRLPSNAKGVYQALCKDPDVSKRFKSEEQAQRVAWRILKDWIEAQMAIIEAGLATLPEVFLPYAVIPNGQTLFEAVQSNGLKMLQSSF